MSDSPETPVDVPSPTQVEFAAKLEQLLQEFDVRGILIYQLPEDQQGEKPTYHSLGRGHFYDTTRLISHYVKEIKGKFMDDLNGLM